MYPLSGFLSSEHPPPHQLKALPWDGVLARSGQPNPGGRAGPSEKGISELRWEGVGRGYSWCKERTFGGAWLGVCEGQEGRRQERVGEGRGEEERGGAGHLKASEKFLSREQ